MKKKILIGILSFVVCLTFGLGCYFIFGGKVSLTTSAPQPPAHIQASGYWSDEGNYSTDEERANSGSGSSQNDPFLIRSEKDFAYYFSVNKDSYSGKYFKLTVDLNMSAHNWKNNKNAFEGVFDGNNHTVTGVQGSESLFSSLSNAEIKNFSLFEISCTTLSPGLAQNCFYSTISNVNVNFTLDYFSDFSQSSRTRLGGFFGSGSGVTVENCTANVNINCTYEQIVGYNYHSMGIDIGGIAGEIYFISNIDISNFTNCNAYGTIKLQRASTGYFSEMNIGGLIGRSSGKIDLNYCMNNVNITLSENYFCDDLRLGGILGYLNNTYGISRVYLEGNTEKYCDLQEDKQTYNSIANSINYGSIQAPDGSKIGAGGICGASDGAILIRSCVNETGVGVSDGNNFSSDSGIGGIIGRVNTKNQKGSDNTRNISIITDCLNYTTMSVSSTFGGCVGGIVGYGQWLKINRCINQLHIYTSYTITGGIIGYAGGGAGALNRTTVTIGNCVNLGSIESRIGYQIVGDAVYKGTVLTRKCLIYNCYGYNGGNKLYDNSFAFGTSSNKDGNTLISEEFYTKSENWANIKGNVLVGGVNTESGLMGFSSYFSSNWVKIKDFFYPNVVDMEQEGNYICKIGGIYLRSGAGSAYHDILNEREFENQKAKLLENMFKEIELLNRGTSSVGKLYTGSGDQFSEYSILDGANYASYIHITCTDKVKVSAVTSNKQLYYDGNPTDIHGNPDGYSKENPCFQPDLNIILRGQSGNACRYRFTPIFRKGSLSTTLYIYLTATGAADNIKPTYMLISKDAEKDPINITSNVGNYINTASTTFGGNKINPDGSITLSLFSNQYSITPKFGYAFYGISSTGSYEKNGLDLADNGHHMNGNLVERNQNDKRIWGGTPGTYNSLYLGEIGGNFDYFYETLFIFMKEVAYGFSAASQTEQTDGKYDIEDINLNFRTITVFEKINLYNSYNGTHSNGCYFTAYYQYEDESNRTQKDELTKFVDIDKETYDSKGQSLPNGYALIETQEIKERAKNHNQINSDILKIIIRRNYMTTKIRFHDNENYYYDISAYRDASENYTQLISEENNSFKNEIDFVGDTNVYDKSNGKSIQTIQFVSANGYIVKSFSYISINKLNLSQDNKGEFSLSTIYKSYMESLSKDNFQKYLDTKNLTDRTIDIDIQYTLGEYTIDLVCLDVNDVEENEDATVKSSVSLKTNEDKKSASYSNTTAYTKSVDSGSIIHYNSGLKLDLSVANDERLVGVYINDNLVTNSVKDPLIFYYSIELRSSADVTLKIRVYFAKYDQVEPGEVPTPVRGVYYISTPKHLQWLSYQVANGEDFEGWLFRQTRDIDMSGIAFNPIGGKMLADGSRRVFKGTYDGNFYRITNLSFVGGNNQNAIAYMGLFGYVEDATIMNLMVEGSSLTGWANVGGVVGYAKNSTFTRVDNRNLAVSLNSQSNDLKYSGVKFIIDGEESYTNTVAVCDNFGGIVGYAENCSFLGCSNQAGVPNTAVGLIGRVNGGKLDQCFTKYGSIVPDEKIENATLTDYSDIKSNHQTNEDKWQNGKLKIFYWIN